MRKLKQKYVLGFLIVVASISLIIATNYDYFKFEYFVWNLESDGEAEREATANEIVKMGNKAIPYLMSNLESKQIFVPYYMVYCLEKITNAQTYDRRNADFYKEVIPFWKSWWAKNSYKY